MKEDLLFEVETPLGFTIRCTRSYWEFIITKKHPALAGREQEVKDALTNPDEIRVSRKDSNVYLFYQGNSKRWVCAVARREGEEGFLITAYPTDAIKAGETLWKKSKSFMIQ